MHSGAPSARVFATRSPDVRKEPDSAERLTKFQPNRSKGKTITAISKWVLKIASTESADMDQTAAKIALFWPSPTGELERRAQLQDFFPIGGGGRFRRELAHMKTSISKLLVLLCLFSFGWFLIFCFLSQTENRKFLKISNRTKKCSPTQER